MKLVSAKCPSCGASLKVNPKSETTKCEYCKQTIIVNDAIAKFKVEITGEIEVKNIPKLDNLLKLADRNYINKNYDEAYKTYDEIIKLDPDNTLALLRYSICKTLINNYIDFTLEHLLNAFKSIMKTLIDNNDTKNTSKYIDEIQYASKQSRDATIKYYNSYTIPLSDLLDVQKKLISCLTLEEELLKYITGIDKEKKIMYILSLIDDIKKDKIYKSGTDEYGGNITKEYKLNQNEINLYNQKRDLYQSMLNPKNEEKLETNITTTIAKKNPHKVRIEIIILSIFLLLLVIGSLSSGDIFSSITLLLLFILIAFTDENSKIFKNHQSYRKILIIILVIVLLVFMTYDI